MPTPKHTKKRTVFLVNNKAKEPDFADSFARTARKQGWSYVPVQANEFSFFYSRPEQSLTLFRNGKRVSLENTFWFIRAWAPTEDATALLCLFLELNKVPFTDPAVNTLHEIRTSKLSQTFQLAKGGCPSPSTWVGFISHFASYEKMALKLLGFPVIVKTRGGSGTRVWKCDSVLELQAKVAQLETEDRDSLMVIQELIHNNGDIRVVVFNNQVIASIERSRTEGFLNNVSQGGTTQAIAITKQERTLALRAAKIIGLQLAGVDIVRSEHGPLLFEVNKAPDITAFNTAAQKDLAAEIATRYLTDLERR